MMLKKITLVWCLITFFGLMGPLHQVSGYTAENKIIHRWLEEGKVAEEATHQLSENYIVQAGDTLWSISRQLGVDIRELREANDLSNNLIRTGDVLFYTVPAQSQLQTHRVKPGETLWSLASCYQISVEQLSAINQIEDPRSLRQGQVLVVSSRGAKVQAVAGKGRISFDWPLSGRITSAFGPRNSGFHHGLDIAGEMGKLINAAESGRVDSARWRSVYGKTVILDHGNGYRTLYAHLSDYLVDPGEMVQKGQVIGKVGSTGNSTGPHLHFEVRIDNKAVDPAPYLE